MNGVRGTESHGEQKTEFSLRSFIGPGENRWWVFYKQWKLDKPLWLRLRPCETIRREGEKDQGGNHPSRRINPFEIFNLSISKQSIRIKNHFKI